jgi:cyclohexadienyl dehydratase
MQTQAGLEGFSQTVAEAYAAQTGRRLENVPFLWRDLLADLAANRFDAAASGVTVRPERSVAGRFSVPVAETGALALVPAGSAAQTLADLDRPEVRVVVNRGGHLERVTRAHLPRARIEALNRNSAVRAALLDGRADAAITDSVEAPVWQRGAKLRVVGPFTRDRKAWLLRADSGMEAARLDRWLLDREADGSLARWRMRHGLEPTPATAEPLAALLAALDERLALMPLVARVKRAQGLPIQAPEREAHVLDAAVAALGEAAAAAGRRAPDEGAVRALYRTQIEVAKAVQRATPVTPGAFLGAVYDLQGDMRPALLRIGEKIARLLVALPPSLDCERVRRDAQSALRAPHLSDADVRAVADAVAGVRGAACPAD